MDQKGLVAAILSFFASCQAAEFPNMGPAWFDRLVALDTRVEALWELEQTKEFPDDREAFVADGPVWLMPAPQKDMPDAWLILRDEDYERALERRYGRETELFPIHPEEKRREADWMKTMRKREKTGEVWKPGEPWMTSVTGILIDESGRQLAKEFWIGAGCLSDFNGDGFLDRFEVSRYHSTGKSQVIDGLSVGPLDPDKARESLWFCNFSSERFQRRRDWKFRVAPGAGGRTELRFVSMESGQDVAWSTKLSEEATTPVYQVSQSEGREWHATAKFFKTIGESIKGVGVDDVDDLNADLHVAPPEQFNHRFEIPQIEGLSPREAARRIVTNGQSSANQQKFDIVSAGAEVAIPTQGWLEGSSDGGCWQPVSATVWELDGDRSIRWEFGRDEEGDFLERTSVPADRVAWTMAVVADLHRIRSVPKHPMVSLRQKHFGSSTAPASMVRLAIKDPQKLKVVTPAVRLWDLVELSGRYQRDHAAAFATILLDRLGESEEPVTRERLDWRKTAKSWFENDRISQLPPILVRRFIQLAGKGEWHEYRDDFRKLKAALNPTNEDADQITRLQKIAELMPEEYLNEETEKKRRTLPREQRALREDLISNLSFELRDDLDWALKQLEGK